MYRINNMLHTKFEIWFSVLLLSVSAIESVDPVLGIKNGYIRGIVNRTLGLQKQYYAFRAIPFAEPPVGNLRFEPPLPKRDWHGVLDATKDGALCVQQIIGPSSITVSEDCLFVNVYTPTLAKSKNIPVMVWVYGGLWTMGSSRFEEYGPDYFLDKDVIVVTFNYRLGIFGFLSTGDKVLPGNGAMKDHILALKWVQENIEYFGGDPKKVTVFGGSSGSMSVSYLLLSPLSKGLFSRAVMQSGVSLSWWSISRKITRVAFEIADKLGIEANNTKTLVRSLKRLNTTYLQKAGNEAFNPMSIGISGLVYAPVIEPDHEGAFLTASSYELLSNGTFIDVPTIIGFDSLEMNVAILPYMRLFLFLKMDLAPEHLVPDDMNIKDNKQLKLVGEKIKRHYFGLIPIALSNYKFRRYLSHESLVRPIRKYAMLLSKKSRVYFYRFAYEGGMSGITYRPSPGAVHSEELGYMWRNFSAATSESDFVTRERLVTMWTNFAKYGDPTPKVDPVLNNVIWLPSNSFGEKNLVFININRTLTLDLNPEKEDMEFWDYIYETYAIPPLETY